MVAEKIKVIFKNIEDQKKELKEGFNDLDAQVKQLFRRSTHLHNNEAALNDLLAETRRANDISSVMYFEKAVGEFQSMEKKKSGRKDAHSGKAEDPGEAAHEEKLSGSKEAEEAKAENSEPAAAEAIKVDAQACQQQGSSDQSQQQTTEVPRAVMDYRDGRLLLHTLAEPATTRLSLQVCLATPF